MEEDEQQGFLETPREQARYVLTGRTCQSQAAEEQKAVRAVFPWSYPCAMLLGRQQADPAFPQESHPQERSSPACRNNRQTEYYPLQWKPLPGGFFLKRRFRWEVNAVAFDAGADVVSGLLHDSDELAQGLVEE